VSEIEHEDDHHDRSDINKAEPSSLELLDGVAFGIEMSVFEAARVLQPAKHPI